MTNEFPIVTYELEQAGCAAIGIGYLVITPDGHAWCFPTKETLAKHPAGADVFPADPSKLKEQADTDTGRSSIFTVGACLVSDLQAWLSLGQIWALANDETDIRSERLHFDRRSPLTPPRSYQQ